MRQRIRFIDELNRVRPDLADAAGAIAAGRVRVDGAVVSNPESRIRRGAAIVVVEPSELRGISKLRAALDGFGIAVEGRIALDLGAAAGGFTSVLIERGARRVYAVDAGHGQLLGSLRIDERIINLEATNVSELDASIVPEPIGIVAVDVSYLSLSEAVRQLSRVEVSPGADLVGLVKPMFELRLGRAPTDHASLDEAIRVASVGVSTAGWTIVNVMHSAVRGAKGAIEGFVHARWNA